MSDDHDVGMIGKTRGDSGKRTVFYGYCTCGAGTTTSANAESVRRKLRAHAQGDHSGIYRRNRP